MPAERREGEAGEPRVGRRRWKPGSRALPSPQRPRWRTPGRRQRPGPLPSSTHTLAFASGASEGSPISPVASETALPFAAVRSPAHRTSSTRSRSSDLNFLRAVMSADIPHAHDTDGSSQRRPSPPRNGRATNRARRSPEGKASRRQIPVPGPAARPTPSCSSARPARFALIASVPSHCGAERLRAPPGLPGRAGDAPAEPGRKAPRRRGCGRGQARSERAARRDLEPRQLEREPASGSCGREGGGAGGGEPAWRGKAESAEDRLLAAQGAAAVAAGLNHPYSQRGEGGWARRNPRQSPASGPRAPGAVRRPIRPPAQPRAGWRKETRWALGRGTPTPRSARGSATQQLERTGGTLRGRTLASTC